MFSIELLSGEVEGHSANLFSWKHFVSKVHIQQICIIVSEYNLWHKDSFCNLCHSKTYFPGNYNNSFNFSTYNNNAKHYFPSPMLICKSSWLKIYMQYPNYYSTYLQQIKYSSTFITKNTVAKSVFMYFFRQCKRFSL